MIACSNGLVNSTDTCPKPGRIKLVMFGYSHIFCAGHGKEEFFRYETHQPICRYLTGRVPVWVTGFFGRA